MDARLGTLGFIPSPSSFDGYLKRSIDAASNNKLRSNNIVTLQTLRVP